MRTFSFQIYIKHKINKSKIIIYTLHWEFVFHFSITPEKHIYLFYYWVECTHGSGLLDQSHLVDPLSHFSFQPVFRNKGCGIYYPVCWIKHIIRKSSPSSGGSGFSLIIYLSALFNKIFPIFLHRFLTFTNQSNDYNDILKCIYVLCLLYRKAHLKKKILAYNRRGVGGESAISND